MPPFSGYEIIKSQKPAYEPNNDPEVEPALCIEPLGELIHDK